MFEGVKMTEESYLAQLNDCRKGIDNVDTALLYMLAERFRYIRRVGVLKAAYGEQAIDAEREKRQIKRLRNMAKNAGIPEDMAEKIFRYLIKEAVADHIAVASG